MTINKQKIKNTLFADHYLEWINLYKKDAVRESTLTSYYQTQLTVKKLMHHLAQI